MNRFVLPICLLLCGCESADYVDVNMVWSVYKNEENERAAKKGFAIFADVEESSIIWKCHRYSCSDFLKAVKREIIEQGLTESDIARAPFTLRYTVPKSTGELLTILSGAEKLGFRVKAIWFCGMYKTATNKTQCSEGVNLPTWDKALRLEDERLDNVCVIDVYADGRVLLNGVVASCCERETFVGIETELNRYRGKKKVVIIRADKDIDYSFVHVCLSSIWRTMEQDADCVFFAGKDKDGETSYVAMGLPVPDFFYWGDCD